MRDRMLNKDTAFTEEERKKYHLTARLPYKVETLQEQVDRCKFQIDQLTDKMQKWMYLTRLQEKNENVFCELCLQNLKEFLPVVYTPTVGTACKTYSDVWQECPRGFYFNRNHLGHIKELLKTWPYKPEIIVATDGTRILGLGDLGTGGHHITVGKLTLYTLGAGFNPEHTLPISFDFGCNVPEIRDDKFYLGLREERNKNEDYYKIIDETIEAVHELWPHCIFQFEDFSNDTAFKLLAEHRSKHNSPVFNDDIQGTGCIAAAVVASAVRAAGIKMGNKNLKAQDQRYVLFGAGAGGIGVADNVAMLSVAEGSTIEEARKQFYVVDTKGLLTSDREDFKAGKMAEHKLHYVRNDVGIVGNEDLLKVIKNFKPTCLLGLSTQAKSFNEEIIKTVTSQIEQPPIILALSNPTVKCEATNQEVYDFSDGKCLYASGSPFPPVNCKDGSKLETAQCNNFYCFPGMGLGLKACEATEVTDLMIVAVSRAIAAMMSEEELAKGQLLPEIDKIRDISIECALGIAREAEKEGKATKTLPKDDKAAREHLRKLQWAPHY